MLTGEVRTMPTRQETTDKRNFCRFVSVRQIDLSSPIFFIADVQISNGKMNGKIQQNKRDKRTEKKETKHYPDFKSIQQWMFCL